MSGENTQWKEVISVLLRCVKVPLREKGMHFSQVKYCLLNLEMMWLCGCAMILLNLLEFCLLQHWEFFSFHVVFRAATVWCIVYVNEKQLSPRSVVQIVLCLSVNVRLVHGMWWVPCCWGFKLIQEWGNFFLIIVVEGLKIVPPQGKKNNNFSIKKKKKNLIFLS